MATTVRAQARPSSAAWPNGSTRLGWQKDVRGREVARHCVVCDEAGDHDARAAFELRPGRPVADEGQCPLAEPAERVGEADHVLPLDQRADADEGRAWACSAVERPEAVEVDAAVHDLGLAARLRHRLLEPRSQPVRNGDHGRRAPNDAPNERPDERILGRIGDVLAVRGDERRPDGPRGDERTEAGRKEEVCVDDVRPEATSGADGAQREAHVAELAAAAAIEDDPLDRVPPGG